MLDEAIQIDGFTYLPPVPTPSLDRELDRRLTGNPAEFMDVTILGGTSSCLRNRCSAAESARHGQNGKGQVSRQDFFSGP